MERPETNEDIEDRQPHNGNDNNLENSWYADGLYVSTWSILALQQTRCALLLLLWCLCVNVPIVFYFIVFENIFT